VISWGGGGLVNGLLGVDSGSLISDIGDESVISVGGVLDVLDSAIGKSNGVRSGNVAGTIGSLLSVEGRLGVVIGNSVGELVGGLLSKVISNISSLHWGMVSWGSMDNWGSVDSVGNNWSSMNGMVGNDWGSMDGMVGNNWGSMGNNWGMDGVSNSVWGNGVEWDNSGLSLWEGSVGSNGWLDLSKSLGVVSLGDGGVGSSESLALAQGSDLTVGGGDRLVRGLSSDNSVVKGGMVGKKNWASWGSSGNGEEGHTNESLKHNLSSETSKVYLCAVKDSVRMNCPFIYSLNVCME